MKINKNPPEKRNYILACVVQSLIGALTSNFQRISFTLEGTSIKLIFELREQNHGDSDEITDIIFELEALFAGEYQVEFEEKFGPLIKLDNNSNIVISMREDLD